MISFDITQLVPEFLRNDKNGYAVAKALEAGLRHFMDTAERGLSLLTDIDNAPEWRLDELAWEYDCLYDYNADIEAKRNWIKEATSLFSAYGTPRAIYNYLSGFFDRVEIEEFWQYGGEPYHFRVTVSGKWTDKNEEWLKKAVASAKNERSVLDDISVGNGATVIVHGEGRAMARCIPPLASETLYTGTYPDFGEED